MNAQEFMESVMEGARLSALDKPCYETLAQNLCYRLHSDREHILFLQELIEKMNQVVSDSPTVQVKCRSCEKMYELPCELSEFEPTMSYCGGSPRCCP